MLRASEQSDVTTEATRNDTKPQETQKQQKAIWNVFIDSLFLNALPVPMLATGFFWSRSLDDFHYLGVAKASQDGPQHGPKLDLVLEGVLERLWEGFWKQKCA